MTKGQSKLDISIHLLQPGLEFAWSFAKQRCQNPPFDPPPTPLKPLMGFVKLPPTALKVVKRTLDQDERFRELLAQNVTDDEIGHLSWLYITRPKDWEEELLLLVKSNQQKSLIENENKLENSARQQLKGAQLALQKSLLKLEKASNQVQALRNDLAQQRKETQKARSQTAQLLAEVEKAKDNYQQLQSQFSDFMSQKQHLETEKKNLAREKKELHLFKKQLLKFESDLKAKHLFLQNQQKSSSLKSNLDVDFSLLKSLAINAAKANEELYSWVEKLEQNHQLSTSQGLDDDFNSVFKEKTNPTIVSRASSRSKNKPKLPPGLRDDSKEAAEFLTRLANVKVLVDGYNITKNKWPNLPIRTQRQRLEDVLEAIALRTGADIEIIFDGDDVFVPPSRTPRRRVKVRFSSAGVEADDLIIEQVGQMVSNRPVVVVSNDRRVVQNCIAQGAASVSNEQFLEAFKR